MADHSLTEARPPPAHVLPVLRSVMGGATNITTVLRETDRNRSTTHRKLRQLKRLTGLSPIQYLQEVRLAEARRLLENRAYNSIAQVASKVGYDDARSFSRSFRQRFGKLPSEMMGE